MIGAVTTCLPKKYDLGPYPHGKTRLQENCLRISVFFSWILFTGLRISTKGKMSQIRRTLWT